MKGCPKRVDYREDENMVYRLDFKAREQMGHEWETEEGYANKWSWEGAKGWFEIKVLYRKNH